VVKLGNEVVGFGIVFENVWGQPHMIGNVFGIHQGRPYNRFQKITHILVFQKKSSLEFMILKCIHI